MVFVKGRTMKNYYKKLLKGLPHILIFSVAFSLIFSFPFGVFVGIAVGTLFSKSFQSLEDEAR